MAVNVDRTLRLPDSEYFPEPQRKSGIAIHHTVCGPARTTVEIWRKDHDAGGPRRVATAYLIERDGTIYETFDPAAWAWQFGLSWPDGRRIPFEKRFIGVELASEGGLVEAGDRLYTFDKISPLTVKSREEAFECPTPWRGYQWFDRYETAQLEALGRLVDELCTRFSIPRLHPDKPFLYYGDALAGFEGIIGHAMVRSDKSDPAPDPVLWQTLGALAGLEPVAVGSPPPPFAHPLTAGEIETLFARNATRLDQMDVAAGSLVKALIMELERRLVFLRLAVPEEGDHQIGYEVVQGDRAEVVRLANALGFKTVTDHLLEVRDA